MGFKLPKEYYRERCELLERMVAQKEQQLADLHRELEKYQAIANRDEARLFGIDVDEEPEEDYIAEDDLEEIEDDYVVGDEPEEIEDDGSVDEMGFTKSQRAIYDGIMDAIKKVDEPEDGPEPDDEPELEDDADDEEIGSTEKLCSDAEPPKKPSSIMSKFKVVSKDDYDDPDDDYDVDDDDDGLEFL